MGLAYLTFKLKILSMCPQVEFLLPIWHSRYVLLARWRHFLFSAHPPPRWRLAAAVAFLLKSTTISIGTPVSSFCLMLSFTTTEWSSSPAAGALAVTARSWPQVGLIHAISPRKKIPDGKSGLPENLPLPVVSEKRIPAKFRIFRFQNSKIQKKTIKNENRIFRPDFVAFRSDFGAFRSENIVLAM